MRVLRTESSSLAKADFLLPFFVITLPLLLPIVLGDVLVVVDILVMAEAAIVGVANANKAGDEGDCHFRDVLVGVDIHVKL